MYEAEFFAQNLLIISLKLKWITMEHYGSSITMEKYKGKTYMENSVILISSKDITVENGSSTQQ